MLTSLLREGDTSTLAQRSGPSDIFALVLDIALAFVLALLFALDPVITLTLALAPALAPAHYVLHSKLPTSQNQGCESLFYPYRFPFFFGFYFVLIL